MNTWRSIIISRRIRSNPAWDLSGAAEDLKLLFEVGYQVANGEKFPEWKPGTEFKAKRDEMMKK